MVFDSAFHLVDQLRGIACSLHIALDAVKRTASQNKRLLPFVKRQPALPSEHLRCHAAKIVNVSGGGVWHAVEGVEQVQLSRRPIGPQLS